MNHSHQFLKERLQKREKEGLLRVLRLTEGLVDFASNDYLGFAHSSRLSKIVAEKEQLLPKVYNGSKGSRLISGNTVLAEKLEHTIANFHQAEAALLFNSGYDANVGLWSCIAGKGDTIISDELVHASMIDGIRLSYAKSYRFRHNDLEDLEKKLKRAEGEKFIAVESIYSMDGDMAPLEEMAKLARHYHAQMIVDEAHATGIFGKMGEGVVQSLDIQEDVFARVHTFGKALGVHGAVVSGSQTLKNYLINFARSFIYTTALPVHTLLSIETAYELLPDASHERKLLQENIAYFMSKCYSLRFSVIQSKSPIQAVLIPGNQRARDVSQRLEEHGIYAKAILSPTVPTGKERLRICLHSFNTKEEIDSLITILKSDL